MERDFPAEFRVSLELEGEKRISASHLFELLENIMNYGSISRASSEMSLSYRYAWGLIREAERALGVSLVDKQVGGYAGGGTSLTSKGKELLAQYRTFKQEINSGLNRFLSAPSSYEKHFDPEKDQAAGTSGKQLLLASTMEPVETGLLDLLENAYYRVNGVLVRHVALGSGRALQMAKEGRVDMVLTHAPVLEEEFMREGWGKKRFPLMSNDFVLAGPLVDPAGIDHLERKEVVTAFQRIAQKRAPFISRGDRSGTHFKELELWNDAGIIPSGNWYIQSAGVAGNLGTLHFASEIGAYTLVDLASFLISGAGKKMALFAGSDQEAGEEKLRNVFVLIIVNPERVPAVKYRDACHFGEWLRGEEGQKIISTFGVENFKRPLFTVLSSASTQHKDRG